jgi:transposase-like protein
MQKELGLRHQKLVEDAQKNHKVAVKFLKASLGRCVPSPIFLVDASEESKNASPSISF